MKTVYIKSSPVKSSSRLEVASYERDKLALQLRGESASIMTWLWSHVNVLLHTLACVALYASVLPVVKKLKENC